MTSVHLIDLRISIGVDSLIYYVNCRMVKVYLAKIHDEEDDDDENTFTLEEYMEGDFTKVLNNTGHIIRTDGDPAQKMLAFAHYTMHKYKGQAMATDLQGRWNCISYFTCLIFVFWFVSWQGFDSSSRNTEMNTFDFILPFKVLSEFMGPHVESSWNSLVSQFFCVFNVIVIINFYFLNNFLSFILHWYRDHIVHSCLWLLLMLKHVNILALPSTWFNRFKTKVGSYMQHGNPHLLMRLKVTYQG